MNWLAITLAAVGGGFLGWRLHLSWCKKRPGCPVWMEEDAAEWDVQAELAGYHKRKHAAKGPDERHPTPVDEARLGRLFAKISHRHDPVDNLPASGVPLPSERRDTPSAITRPANPARKTTP